MMELLAPAGNREALEAAVRGGADAVYLGLPTLNARRGAGNFGENELKEACDFCHERGVQVYVTVNTLVRDDEMGQLEGAALSLYRAGADGAIVQDLGVARCLKHMLPQLPLHASTQMAVHNRQGVRFLKEMGFDRAVMARELTYEEIARCAGEGLPLEVFAHGALCVACSGQCLFSSMVGGRSGNRGMCAQPCRLPYRLEGPLFKGAGDFLSPKDLCVIENLPLLEKAGARSLKLEGRLKGPDYVYKVTSLYRLALDGEKVDASLLRQVFNRGYTKGYGPGVNDSELMSVDEKHVLPETGPWPQPGDRRLALTGKLTLNPGRPMALTLEGDGLKASVQGEEAQQARKPMDPKRLTAQVEKMGGTPYRLEHLEVEAHPMAFAPVSALNALRRQALEELSAARRERARVLTQKPLPLPALEKGQASQGQKPLLCAESGDAHMLSLSRQWGADEAIWAPRDVTAQGLAKGPDFPFTLALPPTLTGDCLDELHRWAWENPHIQGVILSNAAHLAMKWPGQVRSGGAMNVMNSHTARFLAMPHMPSPELTAAQVRGLSGEKELQVYGRTTLMLLRHCPLNHALGGGRHKDCRRCDKVSGGLDSHHLIDRKETSFPLARLKTGEGCIVKVLNSVPLMVLRKVRQLPPAARWRVTFTDESQELTRAVVICHRQVLDEGAPSGPHWDALQTLPSTTGHYFRGVE